MTELTLSPQATRALTLLRAAGYEAWIVGGCVRDALLSSLFEGSVACGV